MTEKSQTPDTPVARNEAKGWLHNPELPIAMSPLFQWPPSPSAALGWLARSWLQLSNVVIIFTFALIGAWLLPSAETMKTLSPGWVLQIWARHILFLTLVAGGLHFWFITMQGQGEAFKFDPRKQATKNRQFLFNNQVHENVFFSLVSGAGLLAGFEVFYHWIAANGWVPTFTLSFDQPGWLVWFAVALVVIPIWSSLHFYWVHRFLHWPPLYRIAHGLHHKNINVGPWSGVSMHPVEHVLYYSTLLIHLVIPSHPILVVFHACLQNLSPPFSHSGFEQLVVRDKQRMRAGDFFHQLHHRYFECNYGTVDMPWDRWFGSFDNGTAESRTRQQARMIALKRHRQGD